MAQKAAKATAKRNAQILDRTHLIALLVNVIFLVIRALLFRPSFTRASLLLYFLLSTPAFVIEFLFERGSRPKYDGGIEGLELRKSGEDLDAKGLTEWMWDVVYWTWGCTIAAALAGDRAWWLYIAIPVYSAWLAYSTFGSFRRSMGGLNQTTDDITGTTSSKRQQKLEKRGGPKTQYR